MNIGNIRQMTKYNLGYTDGKYNTDNCKIEIHSLPTCLLEAIFLISSLPLFNFRICVVIWSFKLCEHFISEAGGRKIDGFVLQVH